MTNNPCLAMRAARPLAILFRCWLVCLWALIHFFIY